MKNLSQIASFFLLVGGINLGLIGLFEYNAFREIFNGSSLETLLELIIGFSAVYKIVNWKSMKSS